VIRIAHLPFVPRGDLRQVDRRWAALCAANPAFFDGRILHVLAVHRNGHGGATLDVAECAYRHWAVGLHAASVEVPHDRADSHGVLDMGVRALGVKAIVASGDAVLLGRRSERVAAYAGRWEFAPGGGLAPGRDPREMILDELAEETGLEPGSGAAVTVQALLFDDCVRSWEIVFSIALPHSALPTLSSPSGEYSRLEWVDRRRLSARGGELPLDGQGARRALTPSAAAMLALLPRQTDGCTGPR